MTLLQLTYAVALDRHGHFGRAAEACHVTQPALSAGLQKLEAELGVVLFDRAAHPIEPTEVGRAVVAQARQVLAEAERLEDLVSEATGELAGELRVGILSTLAPYRLDHQRGREIERRDCDECGGRRFLVCAECNGSRRGKLVFGKYLKCSHCNENGLSACPSCNADGGKPVTAS